MHMKKKSIFVLMLVFVLVGTTTTAFASSDFNFIVDGEEVDLGYDYVVENGRVLVTPDWAKLLLGVEITKDSLVPLRDTAEALDYIVKWEGSTKTVSLISPVNRLIGEKVMGIAATGSLLLNGEFGDLHEEIVADGHRDSEAYDAFLAVLQEIRDINNATYVYTLIKVSEDMTNLIVDAADDPDEYGEEYEMEPQFVTAFNGSPSYAIHTWESSYHGTQKSAFAPIYNSAGKIVALLGIDYPYDATKSDMNVLVGEKVMAIAATGSLLLNGEFGDLHEEIVADGHRDSEVYDEFQFVLQQIRDINNATYVYTLIKVSDDMTNLIVDAAEGDDADEYGAEYEMEPQFVTAFNGSPSYAIHTWEDEWYGIQKSAFAPIYNTKGELVALLGVDYPADVLGLIK